VPHARTGLPRPLEHLLLKPYADTLFGRIWSAGTLRSISVLVRRYPRAALHVAGAGAVQAGKAGAEEVSHLLGWVKPGSSEPSGQDDFDSSRTLG
jgi:hypothetical protein